jgi:transposase
MLTFAGRRVYLACGATDMRKEINGLSAIVELSFKLDLFGEALFVFCNRGRNMLKVLEWDGDGFWMYFKRLEKGQFKWPSAGKEATIALNGDDLDTLLRGMKVEQKLIGNEVTARAII